MIFSREQLDQLAKSNGFSINKLISNRKRLSVLQEKKKTLQNQIKKVLSSSDDTLPAGSSLLMGTINTTLLTSLGYKDIEDLIERFKLVDIEINEIRINVEKEDKKIKSSLSVLGDIDITKDMTDQVTQEVLLDSDLAEVKNNSQEILLMLSQSKTGSNVLKTAMEHTAVNESKLANYLLKSKEHFKQNNETALNEIDKLNDKTDLVKEKLKALNEVGEESTLLDRLNMKLSNLSTAKKNGILAVTFLGFLGMGTLGMSKSKSKNKNKNGTEGEGSKDG